MSDKVDIFHALKNVDSFNINFYQNLSEDEQKTLAMVVLMRWLSGTKNPSQILLVNNLLNTTVFSLYKHPNLLWKLAVASSTGPKTYKWLGKKKRGGKFAKSVNLISDYHACSLSEAEQHVKFMTCEDVVEMAQALNEPSDIIKAIKAEFK